MHIKFIYINSPSIFCLHISLILLKTKYANKNSGEEWCSLITVPVKDTYSQFYYICSKTLKVFVHLISELYHKLRKLNFFKFLLQQKCRDACDSFWLSIFFRLSEPPMLFCLLSARDSVFPLSFPACVSLKIKGLVEGMESGLVLVSLQTFCVFFFLV